MKHTSLFSESKNEKNSVNEFKEAFVETLCAFKDEVNRLALGNSPFADSWTDWLGTGGIVAGTSAAGALLAILSAIGLITVVVSNGIVIGVAIIGLVAGVAFSASRSRHKLHRYQQSVNFLFHEHFTERVDDVADVLIQSYIYLLRHSSEEEAIQLGQTCAKKIAAAILKGKVRSFEQLTNPDVLDDLVKLSAKHVTRLTLPIPKWKPEYNTVPGAGANSLFRHPNDKNYDSKQHKSQSLTNSLSK